MYSNPYQWRRIRKRVMVSGESNRCVAASEGISRTTLRKMLAFETPPGYCGRKLAIPDARLQPSRQLPDRSKSADVKRRWMEWLYGLERGEAAKPTLAALTSKLSLSPNDPRKKILTVLAHAGGFSAHAIAEHLNVSINSVRTHLSAFERGGAEGLLGRKLKARKADDASFKKVLFSLLHEPPSLSGHNRTTWRMQDLQETMKDRGHPASNAVIREAIKKAGFKWRSAKVVLTSNDPGYREKLDHVQAILSGLGEKERFFSIDEFGPFAIKAKPGRVLVEPGVMPSVPQWQKSKGWLIVTAALELSGNQVTHFYSKAKNTTEMIRMAKVLIEKYRDAEILYLSWDAAPLRQNSCRPDMILNLGAIRMNDGTVRRSIQEQSGGAAATAGERRGGRIGERNWGDGADIGTLA